MGTVEQSEVHRGPCPCSKGEIVIELFSPNNMYSTNWFKENFNCAACRAQYELQWDHQIGKRWLVRKADLAERDRRRSVSYKKGGEIEAGKVAPIRAELRRRAKERGRTKRDWYDFLHSLLGAVAALPSYETFDRQTRRGGLDGWLQNHVTVETIEAILAKLGQTDPELTDAIAKLRELQRHAAEPIERLPLPHAR